MDWLPREIEVHILTFLHPYYVSRYLSTCKQSLSIRPLLLSCLAKKYIFSPLERIYLTKKYCNTQEIHILPKVENVFTWEILSLPEIIELSLIYNPIPISVKYYDSAHLLYYACVNNQADIMPYLQDNISEVMWAILWKYVRYKEMAILYERGKLTTPVSIVYFGSMVKLYPHEFNEKVRVRIGKIKIRGSITMYNFMTYYERMLLLISYLELSVFRMSLPRWERNEFQYLTNEQIDSLHSRFGLQYEHNPNKAVKEEKEYNVLIDIDTLPENKRGIYYLTSGHYLEYVLWRRRYGKEHVKYMELGEDYDKYPFCKYLVYEDNGHVFSYSLSGREYIQNMTENKVKVDLCRSKLEIPAFHIDIANIDLSLGSYKLGINTFISNTLPTSSD